MSNQQLYWICQVAGWFFYWLLFTFFNLFGPEAETTDISSKWMGQVNITVFIFFGFLLTHLYRYFLKKYNWIQLPADTLIYRLLISILSLSLIIFGLLLVFLKVSGFWPTDVHLATALMQLFINITVLIALWIFIYYSVQYFRNYRRVQLLSLKYEATVKDVTLNKLRSQLNPHFIFNSLNSIRALISSNPEKARDSITALANIFRSTLQLDRVSLVSFKEELQIVKDYLKLEEIRFEERLSNHFEIADEAWSFQVPPLMLQTLVENAIKHGISNLPKGGKVLISAQPYENKLLIEIINNGQLDFEKNTIDKEKGYGIENTRERLNLLYSGAALFKIENLNAEEVKTTILIPKT